MRKEPGEKPKAGFRLCGAIVLLALAGCGRGGAQRVSSGSTAATNGTLEATTVATSAAVSVSAASNAPSSTSQSPVLDLTVGGHQLTLFSALAKALTPVPNRTNPRTVPARDGSPMTVWEYVVAGGRVNFTLAQGAAASEIAAVTPGATPSPEVQIGTIVPTRNPDDPAGWSSYSWAIDSQTTLAVTTWHLTTAQLAALLNGATLK
jgi:hypothetical protein